MIPAATARRWLLPAAVAGLLAASAVPLEAGAQTLLKGAAGDQPCGRAVRAKLAELGVAPDTVESIRIYRREVRRRVNRGNDREELKGYTAWVVPRDGKGNLVMDLFLNCRVQRVYTTGGFALPGAG